MHYVKEHNGKFAVFNGPEFTDIVGEWMKTREQAEVYRKLCEDVRKEHKQWWAENRANGQPSFDTSLTKHVDPLESDLLVWKRNPEKLS